MSSHAGIPSGRELGDLMTPRGTAEVNWRIPMANRFEHPTWLAMLAVACIAWICCAQVARADDAPDTSTPKKAAMAFCKALIAGDMDKIHALSTGTDGEYALVKLLSDATHAYGKFHDSVTKKFGDQSKFFDDLGLDVTKEYETADYKLDGDTAKQVLKRNPNDTNPPTLKKDGSGWKMDLTSVDKDPQDAALGKRMLPAMTKVFDKMTKNVNDEKYKTFDDLTTDFQKEFTTALTPPPADAPAPAADAPKK
jgi:hypothetical protein